MSNFSDDEIQVRINLCKPIVEAAFSIRGRTLNDEDLNRHAAHWEAVFFQVGTPQLRDLYRAGLSHRCQTAEQFLNVWEAQVYSEHLRRFGDPALQRIHELKAQAATDDSPNRSRIIAKWKAEQKQRVAA